MSTTIYQTPEWQAIANTVIAACLVLFLMITLVILFLRRRNIPVSQTIEVDSREPHSITITFVPAQVISKDIGSMNSSNANTTGTSSSSNNTIASANAQTSATVNMVTPEHNEGDGTNPSIQPQSAPVA